MHLSTTDVLSRLALVWWYINEINPYTSQFHSVNIYATAVTFHNMSYHFHKYATSITYEIVNKVQVKQKHQKGVWVDIILFSEWLLAIQIIESSQILIKGKKNHLSLCNCL